MQRREFCKRAAAVGTASVLGATAVSGTASAHPGSMPVVSTRGHFDVNWSWSWWDDGVYEDELTEGHNAYDYDLDGNIPWSTDELTIVVHGWANDPSGAASMFSTTASELYDAGYDGDYVGFSYDADVTFWKVWEVAKWWAHFDVAKRNGKKLANFISDFQDRNGDATVRLVGHSLGAQPILNALQELDADGRSVDTVSLLGGAAKDDEVSASGTYGSAIENATDECHNYYKTDDQILDKAFSIAEIDAACGEEGCEGTAPDNYADHNVTNDVGSHFEYPEPGGCVNQVVDDWGTIDSSDGGDGGGGDDCWWCWW